MLAMKIKTEEDFTANLFSTLSEASSPVLAARPASGSKLLAGSDGFFERVVVG
jgi:hypothetical protein